MSGQQLVLARKRGRPATGRGQTIGVRILPPELEPLDAYIARQPDPKPTRPEVIRLALREWLALRV